MTGGFKPLKNGGKKKGGGTTIEQRVATVDRFPCKAPPTLADVKAVRREIARVYRFVWENKIAVEDATKLVFILDKMIQAFKSEAELAALHNQYQDAWSGVGIIAPPGDEGALLAAPAVQEIIPPASEENENDETETD